MLIARQMVLPDGINHENPLSFLAPDVFAKLYQYNDALTDRRGDFEIVAIVPLADMTPRFPMREHELVETLWQKCYNVDDREDITPRNQKLLHAQFVKYVEKVFKDRIRLMQCTNSFPPKVVVVLRTRFKPASNQVDFMGGRIDGLVDLPFLASYAMYESARTGDAINTDTFTVFNSLSEGHICLSTENGRLRILPQKTGDTTAKSRSPPSSKDRAPPKAKATPQGWLF